MSKKRVHEIAKEIKAHGIELDYKEDVSELISLGYDDKSRSSSLEADQATAAIQKIVDKRKPKAAPPPVAAKGFVVRRKSGGDEAEVRAMQAPAAEAAPAAPPPEVAPAVEPEPEAPAAEAAPP